MGFYMSEHHLLQFAEMERRVSKPKTMRCISCQVDYDAGDAGTCKKCYKEANETKEELKREIDDLKAKVAFLRFWSPPDSPLHTPRFLPPFFSDVVLVASGDSSFSDHPAVPIPAHKAVLVSPFFDFFGIFLFLILI